MSSGGCWPGVLGGGEGQGMLGIGEGCILGVGAGIGRVQLATPVLSAVYAAVPPQGKAIYVYRAYIYG